MANSDHIHRLSGERSAFERSVALLKAAWALIRSDAALARIALLTLAVQLPAIGSIFLVSLLMPADDVPLRLVEATVVAGWPVQAVSTFAGVMFLATANEALEGRRLSVRGAFGVAWAHRWPILAWAFVAAGVGILLNLVVERIPFGGPLLAWLGTVAWSVTTMFALPILVLEPGTPRAVGTRSGQVFRAQWGTGMVGQVTLGVAATVPVAVAGGIAAIGFAAGGTAGVIVGGSAAVVVLVGMGAAMIAGELFSLVLFRFATTGVAADGRYDEATLRGGLKLRTARRRQT